MKRRLLAVVLPIVWASMALAQSNVGGTWRAEGQPSMPWTFALSVNGTTVVGTATMTGAAPVPIASMGGQSFLELRVQTAIGTVTFTGTWEGEALSFTRDVQVREGGSPGGNGLFGAYAPQRFIARRVSRDIITPSFTEIDPELERRDRPVTPADFRIVALAKSLLQNERVWNRNDDRECADDEANGKRSGRARDSLSNESRDRLA